MLPFHSIRLEHVIKTNALGLISIFSKYYFKTGIISPLSISSYIFTPLEFDSSHFGILLSKAVKPRDHNEIKPPIRKIFSKYKPIRHYFVIIIVVIIMSRK